MESTSVENSDQQEFKTAGMSRNYFCIDCKCSTRNPRLYLEHRRDFHKEPISIHKCDLCVYASKHSQKLARHLRTVHRDLVQDTIQSTSSANFAPSFEVVSDNLQSIQASKNTRLSTCKLCGLFTVSKTVLMDHIRTQHPDVRIYKCDQCDYSHYIRDRYNRHHRYHSMNHIRCKMCEFQTIYRWNLERHMRHHIDAVSFGFRCNKCNFTASTKQSITAHEIAHHSGLHFEINSPDTLRATELPSTSTDEHAKRNDANENEINRENNFDASAFLEVVLDDNCQPKHETESPQLHAVPVKQEIVSDHGDSDKTKYFYCINCNFRYFHFNRGIVFLFEIQTLIIIFLAVMKSIRMCRELRSRLIFQKMLSSVNIKHQTHDIVVAIAIKCPTGSMSLRL